MNFNRAFTRFTTLVLTLGMLGLGGCSLAKTPDVQASAGDMTLDLINFQAKLMQTHPLLESGPLKEELIDDFEALRQSITSETQTDELAWELKKIVAKLGDEHTHISYLGQQKSLPIRFQYTNDGLVAKDTFGALHKGDFIQTIGGKRVLDIMVSLKEVSPKNHENTLLGGVIPRALHMEFYLDHLGLLNEDASVTLEFINQSGDLKSIDLTLTNPEWKDPNSFEYTFDKETATGVFVIRNFMERTKFEKTWASFIDQCHIEQPKHILIDLRESIGGYNEYYFADEIFSALGIKEYTTPYPDFYRHAFKKTQVVNVNKHLNPIQYENLYVATSNFTVSAPTIFAATVKENGFGTIVGQAVSNNMSFFGSGGYNFEHMKIGAGIGALFVEYQGTESIPDQPLKPDVFIPVSAESVRMEIDPVLEWMKSKSTAYKIK
tara:strand:- start:9 stop:1313 length:1305 start_codon:yes stop_codon:yes gene_type:complete